MTWRFMLKKLWILFEFPGNLITGVLSQNWLSGNAVCDKWDPIVDVWQACEKRLRKKSQKKVAVLKASSIFSTLYLLWTMTNNKSDLKGVDCGWKAQKMFILKKHNNKISESDCSNCPSTKSFQEKVNCPEKKTYLDSGNER